MSQRGEGGGGRIVRVHAYAAFSGKLLHTCNHQNFLSEIEFDSISPLYR